MMESISMDKLNHIAHLPTDIKFDHNKILEELSNVPEELYPFRSGFRYGRYLDLHEKENWVSYSLYSIDGSSVSNPEEPWTGDFKPTSIIKQCPYLDSVIRSLGGGKLLARVEHILPNSSVGWHGHVVEAGQPEWISVVQLPLSIPKDSKYSVINFMDYRLSDFNKPIPQYDATYENGNVYIFNSYHYHNAFNYSDDPMIMIRFYVDLREPSVQQYIQKALDSYQGDVMLSYQEYMDANS